MKSSDPRSPYYKEHIAEPCTCIHESSCQHISLSAPYSDLITGDKTDNSQVAIAPLQGISNEESSETYFRNLPIIKAANAMLKAAQNKEVIA
jgi:hypothetical protein